MGVVGGAALLVLSLAACERVNLSSSKGGATETAASTPAFTAFVDTYFDSLFAFSPTQATALGFHQYDDRVDDLSADAVTRRIATLKLLLARLDSLRSAGITAQDSVDAAMLEGTIRSELQDKEVLQNWKHNPFGYVGVAGNTIDVLMKRNYAPAAQRLKSVTTRLHGIPPMFAAMEANVDNPPKEFTDLAILVAAGSVDFFQHDLANWAKEAAGTDTSALRSFTQANDSVIAVIRASVPWLKKNLLPRSKGTFVLGAKNFSDKLKYDEMLDMPLDRVLAIGEANLEKDYKAFVETAKLVAPGKSPAEAMASLQADHPSADSLLPSANATVARIRQFLVDHKIIDIPSTAMPIVKETPVFMRTGIFAAMDTPSPYETPEGKQAFYYVTPVEKDWSAKRVEEHLRLFNRPVMDIITVHEVFPGHYVQFLYAPQYPTKTRKLLYVNSNVEGWAHYGEQMMVEEGFGLGDPKIHLAQLSEALLRDCRYVAGIKEHTQGLTVQQASDQYFVNKCFQLPANAYEEARRGAYDPTYLYYTLGKLMIYKLRDDYRRVHGDTYSLREFHDDFVKQGGLPIPLIRKILLPGDTSSVL